MKNIVFIGMPGSGKTMLAQSLAKELQRPFVDMDAYLVNKYQMTIPEMFAISEAYFREHESLCCQEIAKTKGQVISTGGGIVKDSNNIKVLKKTGILIYLDRSVEDIMKDVEVNTRPLLKEGPEILYALYQERHQKYLMASDIHILNNSKPPVIIQKIVKEIKKIGGE